MLPVALTYVRTWLPTACWDRRNWFGDALVGDWCASVTTPPGLQGPGRDQPSSGDGIPPRAGRGGFPPARPTTWFSTVDPIDLILPPRLQGLDLFAGSYGWIFACSSTWIRRRYPRYGLEWCSRCHYYHSFNFSPQSGWGSTTWDMQAKWSRRQVSHR